MIPLTVAEEIKETLLDYLVTTFNFQDQAVLHVAATRARDTLTITSSGQPSEFLPAT